MISMGLVKMFPSFDLDICDRNAVDMIYNNLIYGTSLLTFNFQKRMVFKSLPASIANQQLCNGQPLQSNLPQYQETFVNWKLAHVENGGCFRCKIKNSCQDIMDYDVEDVSEFLYLPEFIYKQYLFEDEPVNLPFTVEEFYKYYVCDNVENFDNCVEKQTVIDYYNKSLLDYKSQLQLWKSRLSKAKLKRYEEYCRQRDFYRLQC